MNIIKIIFIAATGFALSGCAVFDAHPRASSAESADGTTNRFEVFFDVDRATISETGEKILGEAAEDARQDDVSNVYLTVHTDAAGWNDHSQALSERRADAIKVLLIQKGVPESKISRINVGTNLLTPAPDGIRESQNRRTEIILR